MTNKWLLPAIIPGKIPEDKPKTQEEISALNKKAKLIENVEKVLSWELEQIKIESLGQVGVMKSQIKKDLDKIVIGQDKAKNVFLDIIWSSLFTNTPNKKWVLWAALFLGPTWVGKTQLWEALVEVLLWNEERVEIIQWDTYQEAHEIARLIWSPPGYIGHGTSEPIFADSNLFAPYKEASKNHELHNLVRYKDNFSIVIVDEFEKMHPNIRQAFLWILSKWELKLPAWKENDKKLEYSRITKFHNTIFIFTSNIWAKEASKMWLWFLHWKHEQNNEQEKKEKNFIEALKKELSPEFIWRINRNIVVFDDLTNEDVTWIIHKHERKIEQFLIEEWFPNLMIEFSPQLISYLIKKWYKKESWARELVSTIDYEVLSLLKTHIYEWLYSMLDCLGKLYIDYENEEISVFFKKAELWDIDPKLDDVFFTVRKWVFDIVKWWEAKIPLHNWSMLFTHEIITRLVYSYVQLNKLRDKWWEKFEEEFEYIKSALFNLGFSSQDIKMLEQKSIQSILDENFSFIETYEWFKFADEKEKSVFSPYSWTVVKKIVERKYEELLELKLWLTLDEIVFEIEQIIANFLWVKKINSDQLIEVTKLIHNRYLVNNWKKKD